MELTNEFHVPASVDQTWQVLTDVERVAPCLPGAQLLGAEGDGYRGAVKVKVGPIRAQYTGVARFTQLDEAARTIVLLAEGRDTRGQGTAGATVTAELAGEGEGTRVTVRTDLQITGKVAQFGRNVLADVSDRLLAQFAQNLEAEVLGTREPAAAAAVSSDAPVPEGASEATAPEAPPTPLAAQPVQPVQPPLSAQPAPAAVRRGPDAEYIDLLGNAGPAIARRAAPYAVAVLALGVGWLLGRRSR